MASICSLLSPHLIKNPTERIRIPNPSDWIPKATCPSSRASEPLYSFLNPRRRTLWVSTVAAEVSASVQDQEVSRRLYMGNIPRTLGNDELASIFGEHGSVEKAERMASFSFLKASILANTLMLILPLKALAETCEADNSFFKMPLLFVIALIGATVGGLLARQRKGELRRLNDQLRQINAALRRQAKIESYAPNLSYAPVGRMAETEVIVDPRKQQLITNLRTGKNYLRNQDPEKAFAEFRAALELAQDLGDHVEEKKAARGLGASLQRQGKYREAIKYHSRVLETCKRTGEDSGSTEALGAIADCYTELGDLEQAGKFYDEYIARLRTD